MVVPLRRANRACPARLLDVVARRGSIRGLWAGRLGELPVRQLAVALVGRRDGSRGSPFSAWRPGCPSPRFASCRAASIGRCNALATRSFLVGPHPGSRAVEWVASAGLLVRRGADTVRDGYSCGSRDRVRFQGQTLPSSTRVASGSRYIREHSDTRAGPRQTLTLSIRRQRS